MRTTIDHAGRIVIPKPVRVEAGLAPGTPLDVTLRDGRIEIEAAPVSMNVVSGPRGATISADAVEMPSLSATDVRAVLERVRR